ncbi:hypothetical protein GOP47_0024063 [Adiantum capillus-veneris]|uniref:Uncharacterized protein n=1 Tax=Adiantum capillus-veneris TaxID=13818 RepID=A0A9D4U4X7_ADICA|nr:hypothetical protein GOP47_0024063 [Adiantum capillus-veneris]
MNLEVHDRDYLRFLVELIDRLYEDEGETTFHMFHEVDEDESVDPTLEMDYDVLDDVDDLDEGVPMGLPGGLYRMLFPRQ